MSECSSGLPTTAGSGPASARGVASPAAGSASAIGDRLGDVRAAGRRAAWLCQARAMEVLRTPDDRFAALPGWPYEPLYTEIPAGDGEGTLRIHHVDEGPPDADPVLCLHGEPSWGYLYRKMIPVLAGAGLRVVVPDLVGFGRSDKPVERADYTYQRHVDWMSGVARGHRPPPHHARLPGLGRADRPAPGGRAPGPLRPPRRGQHLPADR